MYELPEDYIRSATRAGRNYSVRIDVGEVQNGAYVDKAQYTGGKGIISLKIVRGQTTGGFLLGGTVCATLSAVFDNNVDIKVNDRIQVYVGFGTGNNVSHWHGLGWFYADSVKKGTYSQNVTACDAMLRFSKNYKSKLTYPAKVSDVLSEISGQTKINLSSGLSLFNDVQIEKLPEKGEDSDGEKQYYTRREMLGYLSSINGGSAYIDIDFKINFAVPSETGYTISAASVIEQTVDDTSFSVEHIVWNRSGISYSLGDEFKENTVEITDPLSYTSSELVLHGLETYLIGLSYDSVTIKKQGTGMFRLGDIVNYEALGGKTYRMLIMGIVYDFSGGFFSETLYSLAKSASQQEFAGNKVIDQTEHIKETAGSGSGGVGKAAESDPTSEYFNDYENNKIVTYAAGYNHVDGKDNKCGPATACHVGGVGNSVRYGTALRAEGSGNTLDGGTNSSVGGNGNIVRDVTATRVDGTGNTVERAENSYIIGRENIIAGMSGILAGESNEVSTGMFQAIFGKHLKSAGNRPRLIIGEFNQARDGVVYYSSLAFEIGCGTSEDNRRSCFAVDYEGNVYCNKVIETGSDNILGGAAEKTSPAAARAARAITSASSAGIPIVMLDHAPTAEDLTGSPCVFLKCENAASVEGETTGIFRVTDIFAEKAIF